MEAPDRPSSACRRQATQCTVANFEHTPAELLARQMRGAARPETSLSLLIEHARRTGWNLEAHRIACPVRVVWGTGDRLLP